MTGTSHPNLPQGYVQLTEGRVRTTDLVLGKHSGRAALSDRAVGEDGTKVARRVAPQPKSARARS